MSAALETILRRERTIVAAALAAVTALAWIYLFWLARSMNMTSMPGMPDMHGMPDMPGMVMSAMAPAFQPWTDVQFGFTFLMWAVMMLGMMTPSAAPMILIYARVGRQAQQAGKPLAATGWFASGYFFSWIIFSFVATFAQWELERVALVTPMMASANTIFGGIVLLAAGLYQYSPLKDLCLKQCRAPWDFIQRYGGFKRDAAGSLLLGLRHGTYCIGCCWLLMALLFVGGVMNMLWIAGIAALVLIEKVVPGGRIVARTAGAGLTVAGILLLFGMPAFAQDRATIRAVRLGGDQRITLDGRLDEPVWQTAESASDFKQSDPQNGEPATERSDIRIAFDRDNLYIGAELYDSNPEGLLGNQMVRDGNLNADDRFMWILDPFDDHQGGYFFEVNPSGSMGDAQLVPSTGGSNFGSAQNRSWDGIWMARVRRHDEGWTVEIEIPFRTLNFNPQQDRWGANFQRTMRRKNEETFWTSWDRNGGLMNLALSGQIEGISDVSQGHGLDIKPYVIGTYREDPGRGIPSTYKGTEGIDFFYNVTPQLKANLTINTDFAQTEVDDRQVNLTRFPLFFPEKRDFFLDSSGYFDFTRETQANITAFFTRRIGLNERTGRPQKIDYGAKIAGRAGDFDLGFMQVRTAQDGATQGEDFTVFRPKFRFLNQSHVGMIYTRRDARNSTVSARQTIGADFQIATSRFRGSQNLSASGYFLKTPDGSGRGEDQGWGYRVDYPNDRWAARYSFKSFEKNMNPALGFIEQADYYKHTPGIMYGPRPRNSRWIRQVTFEVRAELYKNRQGKWTQRDVFLTPFRLEMQSGDTMNFQILPTYDYFESDFRIATGITLPKEIDYKFTRYSFGFSSANRRKVAVNGNVAVGTFYTGHRRDLSATVNIRPRRGILATFTGTFNRVELAEGNFSTKILRAVVNTQFSPFISIANNIQYDSVSRVLGWQTRFRWIVRPGNDIYVVWLENWVDTENRLAVLDRSAAVKLTYTYRF